MRNLWHLECKFLRRPGFSIEATRDSFSLTLLIFHFSLVYCNHDYVGRRRFSIYWMEGQLWIVPGLTDEEGWSGPWYRRFIILRVKDWVLGKPKYTREDGEPFTVAIPMPEGSYLATVKSYHCVWRFRFHKIERRGYDFDLGKGIPFQGKGENSWDCGDDALCGIGVEGELEHGIGYIVESALTSRKRYGEVDWTRGRVLYAQ